VARITRDAEIDDPDGLPARVAAALAPSGLILRGGLNFAEAEDRPPGPGGLPARSVLLVGNGGAGYWSQFSRWRAQQPATTANPLDTWSRAVIGAAAEATGGRIVMPNYRPFQPFQQWAMRAEGLKPSPLGLLIHPRFGLWHAFRGALLFDVEIPIQAVARMIHPCDLCIGKPCLNHCPVSAHAAAGFAYDTCLSHVRGGEGAPCRDQGCLARNACPHGAEWRYPAEVQAFHQRAFAGL
jgi:hypothetical protein